MSVALLLVVVGLCADGTPGELCSYDDGVWFDPGQAQLIECAERAEQIRSTDGQAICEVVPAESGPDLGSVTPASLKF